jgi:hypothetical protein
MFVHGVSRDVLDMLASRVGLRLTQGRAKGSIRLRHDHYWPRDARPWQAYSPARTHGDSDRRIGVCWHGYMAFFSAVFHDTPNAHIKTSLAEWDDSSVYFRTVRQTKQWNGSVQCHCDNQDKDAAYEGFMDKYWHKERGIYEPRHAATLARRQEREAKKQHVKASVDALLASALPHGV